MSVTDRAEGANKAEPLYCGCDPMRWQVGWISAGCRIHGLRSDARGWRASREDRPPESAWERGIREVAR